MTSTRRFIGAALLALILFSQVAFAQTQSGASGTSTGNSTTQTAPQKPANCTNNGTYVNSSGQTVQRPENCGSKPQGATAQCRDGTYSFSKHRQGTCSHHGGVAKWL